MALDISHAKIAMQTKNSLYLRPIYKLINDATTGRGRFSVTDGVDVGYLIYFFMTIVIRHMGTTSAGLRRDDAIDSMIALIKKMKSELKTTEATKIAVLVVDELLNESESFQAHQFDYFDGHEECIKKVQFKIIDFRIDDGDSSPFCRLTEEGFFAFRSMINTSADLLQEMNAFVVQYYIEQKDYFQAIQSINEGITTLLETQGVIQEIRRRLEFSQRINYKKFKEQCIKINNRIEPAFNRINDTYNLVPLLANDGSEADQQIKLLDHKFLEFIEMFSQTINSISDTREKIENRLISRINNSSKDSIINFSLVSDALEPLLLMKQIDIEHLSLDFNRLLFPAVIKKIESPYQWVVTNLSRLEIPDAFEEDDFFEKKDEKTIVVEEKDTYFTKGIHNIEFKSIVVNALSTGPKKLSWLLSENKPIFEKYKLKSFYLYLLGEYLEPMSDIFFITKLDEIINVDDTYQGNELLIKLIKEDKE